MTNVCKYLSSLETRLNYASATVDCSINVFIDLYLKSSSHLCESCQFGNLRNAYRNIQTFFLNTQILCSTIIIVESLSMISPYRELMCTSHTVSDANLV